MRKHVSYVADFSLPNTSDAWSQMMESADIIHHDAQTNVKSAEKRITNPSSNIQVTFVDSCSNFQCK